ncbi:MAG: hypothetical protein CMH53_07825 [Myxococcales bacterium]|nr:hypothetical protein [Myxococcales bacterium]
MSVGLDDGGLAPFVLPEGFALTSDPAAVVAPVDGGLRLVGCTTNQQLVVIDKQADRPPQITEARALADIWPQGHRPLCWAFDPSAPMVAILVQPPGQSPVVTRLRTQTLTSVDITRVKPPLRHIGVVQGRPGHLMACSDLSQRSRGDWALGRYDCELQLQHHWDQQQLVEPIAALNKTIYWAEEDRVFASYDLYDPFNPEAVNRHPSLAVWRGQQLVFASSDLRRRFAPTNKIVVDHPWTLDPAAGRLWFAAQPRADNDNQDAMLLGVDARTLRPQPLKVLEGAARILAIHAVEQGAAALIRSHEGTHMWALVSATDENSLTPSPLPV